MRLKCDCRSSVPRGRKTRSANRTLCENEVSISNGFLQYTEKRPFSLREQVVFSLIWKWNRGAISCRCEPKQFKNDEKTSLMVLFSIHLAVPLRRRSMWDETTANSSLASSSASFESKRTAILKDGESMSSSVGTARHV
jgi:hypothetical protein